MMMNQKKKCRKTEFQKNLTDNDVECLTGQSLHNVSLEWADQCVSDVRNNRTLFQPFRVHHQDDNNKEEDRRVWKNYALGDCITICWCRFVDEYPRESFLREYHRRACEGGQHSDGYGGNLSIIHDIFQLPRSQSFSKPDEDVLLIHLRLGDKVERNLSNRTAAEILVHGAQAPEENFLGHRIKSLGELLGNAKEANVSKVELVGGSHKMLMFNKSRPYQYCIQRGLEEHGFTVTMRTAGNPDEDFYYVSHAKKLVIAVGTYSRLMGQMAVLNGGEVFGRTFGALKYPQLERLINETTRLPSPTLLQQPELIVINETTRLPSLTSQPELIIINETTRRPLSIVANTNDGSTSSSSLYIPSNTPITAVGMVVYIGLLLNALSWLKTYSVKARRPRRQICSA